MRATGSGKTPERLVQRINDALKTKSLNSISKTTGVGISALHRYQRGIGEPTTATLQKLADYFKVSVGWLRGETDLDYEEWKNVTHQVDAPTSVSHRAITALIDAYIIRDMPIPQCGEELRGKFLNALHDNAIRESERFKRLQKKYEQLTVWEIDMIIKDLNLIKMDKKKKVEHPPED